MEQDDNGDDWTFSLNHDEVVIKFTDSVTKIKGSKNVMFHEIELSRVLVDLKVEAALNPMKIVPLYPIMVIHYTNSGSS